MKCHPISWENMEKKILFTPLQTVFEGGVHTVSKLSVCPSVTVWYLGYLISIAYRQFLVFIVLGHRLHELSNLIFWGKIRKKYFLFSGKSKKNTINLLSAEFATEVVLTSTHNLCFEQKISEFFI